MSIEITKKKLFIFLSLLVVIIAIPLTVYLSQRQQEIRSRAEKSTTLTLTPPNQNISVGEDAKLVVTLDPGVNQVNFVKFTIKFDPARFNPALTVFNVDPDSSLKAVGASSLTSYTKDGEVTFTLSVGSDPTKVVQTATKLGTIILPALKDAATGSTSVVFDEAKTQVRSIGGKDTFTENVLSSTVPATVTIGAAICRPNVSTCSWDSAEGATSYHYVIDKNNQGGDLVKEGDTRDTSVEFPSVPGESYLCGVTATNKCGTSDSASGESRCSLPTSGEGN